MPNTTQQLFARAQRLHQQRQLAAAEPLYRQLVTASPGFANGHHLLGILLSQLQRYDEATVALRRALQLEPANPVYHHNYGKVLADAGRYDDAIGAYRSALQLQPDFAEAWHNLGNAWRAKNNLEQSCRAFQRAVKADPNHVGAHYNLGNTYREMGRMRSALETFQRCLTLQPDHALALNNRGSVLEHWDRDEEAIQHYQRAIALDENAQEPLSNLARLYEKQGRTALARETLKQWKKRTPPAKTEQRWLDWRLRQMSEIVWTDNTQIDRFRTRLSDMIAQFRQQPPPLVLADLTSIGPQPPFDLAYHGRDDKAIKVEYGNFFNEYFKHIRRQLFPEGLPAIRTGKRRLGIVVTSGHEGVFLKCMAGIVNRLPNDDLEVTLVCSAPSGPAILQAEIQHPDIHYQPLPSSFDGAVRTVHAAGFDLLYYWEVGTDATNYFLPFCRLAPVQCTSWGWPVTSGIPTVDYFISCIYLEPEGADQHYSEQLILLNKLPTYYAKPPVPITLKPKSAFGLSGEGRYYLCAQNLRKVHPDFDVLVEAILIKDPEATVLFIEDKRSPITQKLRDRFKQTMPKHHQRIRCLSRMSEPDYLNLVAVVDVILDTLHYTGGANTAYDAVAAGTPYVTLPTGFHRGRFGAAVYQQMGLSDLIASSPEDYVEKAVRLATDADHRARTSERIVARQDTVFEDGAAVWELRNFFLNVQ